MKLLAELDETLSEKIPADIYSKLEAAMAGLEQALLAKDPLMPKHLQESHRLLISYPETVHLLDDEEVARLLDAAQAHMKVQIVAETAKATGTKRRKIDVSDL